MKRQCQKESARMKEFLLSDESVNSHGCIVITEGIRLDRFLKNPVMFYNHNESMGVVGRWENLRKQDGKLYGTPVFDVHSDTGRQLKQQVENGFVRGASIGIEDIEYAYNPDNAQPETIISCELIEVSVCDIPSNRNTLQLYYNRQPVDMITHKRLSLNKTDMTQQEINEVLSALGLPENATLAQALSAIDRLKENPSESGQDMLKAAIKCGYIKSHEGEYLAKCFAGNGSGLKLFLDNRRKAFQSEIDKEYARITLKYPGMSMLPKEELKALMNNHLPLLQQVIECAKPKRMVMDDIHPSGRYESLRLDWTLDDYRKKAPMELRRNPELYQKLLNQEHNTKTY